MTSSMHSRYWRNMLILGSSVLAGWLVWEAVKGWFGL